MLKAFDQSSIQDICPNLAELVGLFKNIQSTCSVICSDARQVLILMKKTASVSPSILEKLASISSDQMCLRDRCCLVSSTTQLLQVGTAHKL